MTENSGWLPVTETPESGQSIWAAVLEWDGENTHVDFGVVWDEVDGLNCKLSEEDQTHLWPPSHVIMWMPAEAPRFDYREAQTDQFERWLFDEHPRQNVAQERDEHGKIRYVDNLTNAMFEAWFANSILEKRKRQK
jgi:hypothetical protein